MYLKYIHFYYNKINKRHLFPARCLSSDGCTNLTSPNIDSNLASPNIGSNLASPNIGSKLTSSNIGSNLAVPNPSSNGNTFRNLSQTSPTGRNDTDRFTTVSTSMWNENEPHNITDVTHYNNSTITVRHGQTYVQKNVSVDDDAVSHNQNNSNALFIGRENGSVGATSSIGYGNEERFGKLLNDTLEQIHTEIKAYNDSIVSKSVIIGAINGSVNCLNKTNVLFGFMDQDALVVKKIDKSASKDLATDSLSNSSVEDTPNRRRNIIQSDEDHSKISTRIGTIPTHTTKGDTKENKTLQHEHMRTNTIKSEIKPNVTTHSKSKSNNIIQAASKSKDTSQSSTRSSNTRKIINTTQCATKPDKTTQSVTKSKNSIQGQMKQKNATQAVTKAYIAKHNEVDVKSHRHWSSWYNSHTPTSVGKFELLSYISPKKVSIEEYDNVSLVS